MAQIPLNLKTKILFDYNLVDLGFPKLKNLLNTLSDKIILESTKTHTTYETTTNGTENIEKLRAKLS
jgi:predicted transcriptional regulator